MLDFVPMPIHKCHDIFTLQNNGLVTVAKELSYCNNMGEKSGGGGRKRVNGQIPAHMELYHRLLKKLFLKKTSFHDSISLLCKYLLCSYTKQGRQKPKEQRGEEKMGGKLGGKQSIGR